MNVLKVARQITIKKRMLQTCRIGYANPKLTAQKMRANAQAFARSAQVPCPGTYSFSSSLPSNSGKMVVLGIWIWLSSLPPMALDR